MIDFKNLIIGRHEANVLFMWNSENGVAMLRASLGIKDKSRPSSPETESLLSSVLSSKSSAQSQARTNGDFATLRGSLL
jgi:hypothetical protein